MAWCGVVWRGGMCDKVHLPVFFKLLTYYHYSHILFLFSSIIFSFLSFRFFPFFIIFFHTRCQSTKLNVTTSLYSFLFPFIHLFFSLPSIFHLFTHSSIHHSIIHPSIYLHTHPSIHSPTYPFHHPSIHPPIHPFTHSFIHPSTHSSTHAFTVHAAVIAINTAIDLDQPANTLQALLNPSGRFIIIIFIIHST